MEGVFSYRPVLPAVASTSWGLRLATPLPAFSDESIGMQPRVLKTPFNGILHCDLAQPEQIIPKLRTPLGRGFSIAKINMIRADGAVGGGQPVGAGLHPMALELIKIL